jgi:hypothetical protein
VQGGDPADNPSSPAYRRRFLAEGDSWFSAGAVPTSNLLQQLRLAQPSIVLSLAQPGDTIVRMGSLAANPLFRRYLAHPNFAEKWDAVLLSGGGNDLIDEVDRIIVGASGSGAENYVDAAALQRTLTGVSAAYERIVEMRDAAGSPNRGVALCTHTYDRVTPRNSPARFVIVPMLGPWLYRRFQTLGIADRRLRNAISDYVFDRLADTLLGLARTLPDFRVVDTRDTLKRARPQAGGTSFDWLNEIHPTAGGYRKLAAKLARVL